MTPAQTAAVDGRPWEFGDIVKAVEEREATL